MIITSFTNGLVQFFDKVLTTFYLEYSVLFSHPDHWMFLLACGAVVNNRIALEDLQSTLSEWNVPYTFGFTAPTFNTHLTSDFIAHFGTRILIQTAGLKEKTICHMLDLCWNLCRHGSLILFRYSYDDKCVLREEYQWIHLTLQPGRHPLPMQCPLCKCIGSLCFPYQMSGC